MRMRLLNIGCGKIVHSAWLNIDLESASPLVISHDIRHGLPFESESVDACYTSHMIEHLTHDAACNLLKECRRVLKPGGVIRVVVPDMEAIVRAYLDTLERVRQSDASAEQDYKWMMVELLDQCVRERGGGEMAPFLRNVEPKNRPFIRQRLGLQAEPYWENKPPARRTLIRRIRENKPGQIFLKLREIAAKAIVGALLGGRGIEALAVGLFRGSGEVHRWMYDSYSILCLLEECGFRQVVSCQANESRIPGFEKYELDVINGRVIKTNSLFVEGLKV